jgi:hypothetical protein
MNLPLKLELHRLKIQLVKYLNNVDFDSGVFVAAVELDWTDLNSTAVVYSNHLEQLNEL